MDEKTKELIAIGASITAHCQPCLKYHLEQAVKLGISTEEINSAITVGKTIEKGALKAMDDFSKNKMERLNASGAEIKPQKSNNSCSNGNSCCCLSEI